MHEFEHFKQVISQHVTRLIFIFNFIKLICWWLIHLSSIWTKRRWWNSSSRIYFFSPTSACTTWPASFSSSFSLWRLIIAFFTIHSNFIVKRIKILLSLLFILLNFSLWSPYSFWFLNLGFILRYLAHHRWWRDCILRAPWITIHVNLLISHKWHISHV